METGRIKSCKKTDIPCNLCESNECDLLFNAKDRLHGYEGTFTYVRCKKCGLVYMNPQISSDDIAKFYPPDYGPHQAKAEKQQQNKRAVETKLKRRPFVASICGKLTQQSRLLDVGCGSGGFLNEIKTVTDYRVYGVDISNNAAKAAKENYGLDIFTGTVLESPFPDNYFDVVTAWAYLEHVNNPSEVLLKISNLLKDDGLFLISTPNFDSFNSKLFKEKWYHLDCPRHLYIYTPKTITGLMEKAGLLVEKIIYDKSSKGVLGSLQYYFYGDNFNPQCRNRIRRSSMLKSIVSPFARIAAPMKQSDTMAVFAKKAR